MAVGETPQETEMKGWCSPERHRGQSPLADQGGAKLLVQSVLRYGKG